MNYCLIDEAWGDNSSIEKFTNNDDQKNLKDFPDYSNNIIIQIYKIIFYF